MPHQTGFVDDNHIIIGNNNPAPLALSEDILILSTKSMTWLRNEVFVCYIPSQTWQRNLSKITISFRMILFCWYIVTDKYVV